MKKRIISLFLSIIMIMSLLSTAVFAAGTGLSAYALDGYYNKQLNNNWAEVTLSDETDENGVITTTASYSGELAAGKRIASFQPWADEQGTAGSAAGEYTMHFGFTVTEITDMVSLLYQYRNSGGGQTLLYFSDDQVIAGDKIETGNAVSVQLPYTVNMFMNIKTGAGYIYVNDQCIFEGNMNASKRGQWREVRVSSVAVSNNIKLVTTAANSSVYNDGVSLQDVVDAYMGTDEPEVEEPEIPEDPENPGITEDTGIKDMSKYALTGFNNNQLESSWIEDIDGFTLNTVTDSSTGVKTSAAVSTVTVGSGKRVATFQPWEKNAVTRSGAKPYTMHFGFTVNEVTAPVRLEYRYSGGKNLVAFDNKKVAYGGDINGSTYLDITLPYTINIFMNVQTGIGVIYVNDTVLYDGRITNSNFFNSSSDTKWNQVRAFSLTESSNFKLVTTAANGSVFNENVILTNVVDYIMNKQNAVETNWLWSIEGIKTDWKKIQGAMDGICTITGNNTDGYVLQPNSINESHYGYARYFLGHGDKVAIETSTSDKVLWQSFEYNPTVLTNGQIFEVRGNNAYQTLITAVPATETESAYLKIGSNKVAISSDKFYKIDFIVNNKDYEYYILVDGKVQVHNRIWDTRTPLWQTVFSSYTTDEKMTLKNVKTTLYDSSVSMIDVLQVASTSVYADISDVVYDEEVSELVVTATLVGNAQAYEEASLVYVLYAADGTLLDIDYPTTYSEDINATEFGRAYPYGVLDTTGVAEGEKLTIKAFVWNSIDGMKSLSSAGTYEYTIPTTEVVE